MITKNPLENSKEDSFLVFKKNNYPSHKERERTKQINKLFIIGNEEE